MLRPDWGPLFRKGARRQARQGLSVPRLAEDAGVSSGSVADAIPPLSADPVSPEENEAWLRADKEPPELRLFSGGRTWALAFAQVAAEPPEPLAPDVALAPPLVPEGAAFSLEPLVPDAALAPPLVPEGV